MKHALAYLNETYTDNLVEEENNISCNYWAAGVELMVMAIIDVITFFLCMWPQ